MTLPREMAVGEACAWWTVVKMYDYVPLPGNTLALRHVNFADPVLFVAYGGGLLAQDEMQVVEHPGKEHCEKALIVGATARSMVGRRPCS